MNSGRFDVSDLSPVSDDECLNGDMRNIELTYETMKARGMDLSGTQIERIVLSWRKRDGNRPQRRRG